MKSPIEIVKGLRFYRKVVTSFCDYGVVLKEDDPNIFDGITLNSNLLIRLHLSVLKTCAKISFALVSDNTYSGVVASDLQLFKITQLWIKQFKAR